MRRRRNNHQEENFWPSFTDMISTIALILFFLMLIAYINNIVSGKNLEYAKKQLVDTQLRLEESKVEISQAENQLRLLKDDLDQTMAELEIGEIALKLSEVQIEDQMTIIADSNLELGILRSKLEGIAVLRLSLLESVKGSIEENLGTTAASGEELVLIADNGNIVINESLVFEYDSYTIKPEGKVLLDKLAQAFSSVLSDDEVRASIDAISIQGHTDERGSAEYNRELSAKRAYAVVNYMLDANPALESNYGEYFAASAYSEFRPLDRGTTEEAYSKNRRIEISVILQDSNVQNIIDEYLDGSMEAFEE
jgi:chemotaxis protein MotB